MKIFLPVLAAILTAVAIIYAISQIDLSNGPPSFVGSKPGYMENRQKKEQLEWLKKLKRIKEGKE